MQWRQPESRDRGWLRIVVSVCWRATVMAYVLGMGDVVVVFSHKCDYPPDAVHGPKTIEPVFDTGELDSRRIEELAREYSKHGERLYGIKLEMLKKANSDMPCELS